MASPRSLVVQLARFGDLLQSKRLVASLLAQGEEVHLCVDQGLAELAELVYPNVVVHALAAHASFVVEASEQARSAVANIPVFETLRRADFRAIYNLNFSGLNLALSRLFAHERVHGYYERNGQSLKSPWFEMGFRFSRMRSRAGLNLVDYWAHLLEHPVAPQEVNPTAAPRGGGLGVVLAGRNQRRSLPVPLLAGLVQAVHGRLKKEGKSARIILLGGPDERAAGKELAAALPAGVGAHVQNLAGKTDYTQLHHEVSGLDRLLTPDTGTMHLAAHLGVPVTACFLSNAWCFETGPFGAGHTVYQAVDSCLPCVESRPCPHEVRCRAGFGQPGLLRHAATGKLPAAPDDLIPGMVVCHSALTELGVDYQPAHAAPPEFHADERAEFRAFVAEHLHLPTSAPTAHTDTALAHKLYLEKDWATAPRD